MDATSHRGEHRDEATVGDRCCAVVGRLLRREDAVSASADRRRRTKAGSGAGLASEGEHTRSSSRERARTGLSAFRVNAANLEMDLVARRAVRGERLLDLTAREFDVLEYPLR